jgi:hypothetical protein
MKDVFARCFKKTAVQVKNKLFVTMPDSSINLWESWIVITIYIQNGIIHVRTYSVHDGSFL